MTTSNCEKSNKAIIAQGRQARKSNIPASDNPYALIKPRNAAWVWAAGWTAEDVKIYYQRQAEEKDLAR